MYTSCLRRKQTFHIKGKFQRMFEIFELKILGLNNGDRVQGLLIYFFIKQNFCGFKFDNSQILYNEIIFFGKRTFHINFLFKKWGFRIQYFLP